MSEIISLINVFFEEFLKKEGGICPPDIKVSRLSIYNYVIFLFLNLNFNLDKEKNLENLEL